jgi:hypothetical protein
LKSVGLFRQVGEHGLCNLFRDLRIVAGLAQRYGINKAQVAFDQLRKGSLGSLAAVAPEQFRVMWNHGA